ncbi:MAG: carbon-nitrogen hydrolase family protein, partial [Gammaproteobacteria bacterium]|nr:carbon-nitrogen hydrolase family protein [Gammaproteobacteria bacterium]
KCQCEENVDRFTAAIVQWHPEVHDADAGSKKACRAIQEAAEANARVVAFPELWLQGYPYWASNKVRSDAFQQWRAKCFNAAIDVNGPEIARVAKAAEKYSCNVVISAHERAGGTIYNSQIFIGNDGSILGCHRKLMPTQTERLVHGMGDGADLNVYDTSTGRLGGLLCYEHQMALARFALCTMGVQLHVAAWPGHAFLDPIIDASMRQLALENGCFVMVARE